LFWLSGKPKVKCFESALLSIHKTLAKIVKMRLPYKEKRNLMYLVSSTLWGIYAVNGFLKEKTDNWTLIALFCSICFFLYFIFEKKTYYLTLKEGIIKTGKIFGKKVPLTEITKIVENEKNYILKTNELELRIEKILLEPEMLNEFSTELKKYNVEWK